MTKPRHCRGLSQVRPACWPRLSVPPSGVFHGEAGADDVALRADVVLLCHRRIHDRYVLRVEIEVLILDAQDEGGQVAASHDPINATPRVPAGETGPAVKSLKSFCAGAGGEVVGSNVAARISGGAV